MIENRDKLIGDLKERKDYYKEKSEIQGQKLNNIKKLISNHEQYNTNIYTLIRDIKNELDNSLKSI